MPHIRLTGFALADAAALQAKLDSVGEAVDAWRHEEISRRDEAVVPVRSANGQLVMTADLEPLAVPNPYYVPGGWTPQPFTLKFVAVKSEPASGEVSIELEPTVEYRSLVGAIRVVAGSPSDTTEYGRMRWPARFRAFRDPAELECSPPTIVLRGPGATPAKVVQDLTAAGDIVEGKQPEVRGFKEVKIETLALMRGDEQEGWTEVANLSLLGDGEA